MAEPLPLAAAGVGCVVVTVSRCPSRSPSRSPLPKGPWSASGVLLSLDPGLILCHGAIFSPFLLDSQPPHGSQRHPGLLAESFSSDMRIQVLGPGLGPSQAPRQNWLGGDQGEGPPVLRLNPLSNHRQEVPGGTKQWEAELILMAPCLPFQEAFSKVFTAADQWNFGGSDVDVGQEASALEEELRFLHWFALLRLLDCDFHGADGWLRCLPAKWLKKGDPVFACGSPFGSFCPDIFMNTLSKGIVSNTAGEGNALILTDARCLPGTEGGGVFATLGARLHLMGIIVAPLCWKSNEWVGLTLVCAIDHILAGIKNILSEPPWFLKTWLHSMELVLEPRCALLARKGTTQQMLAAVVLVECGPTWGSGVLVNSRLVLTCRHVVNGASSVSIRLQPSPDKASIVKGKVVFATKDSSPYDIALVELEENLSAFQEPVLASQFYTGEDVSIVGFGVFGQACGPSVTSGILSAVITVEDKPVMLQATCAVHGGSSGGALFATHSGKLLGIVASNTKDNSLGVTYPHLNFSIPVTVLQPAILEYIHSRSLSEFQALNWVGDKIQVVWRLQKEPEEILLSKL